MNSKITILAIKTYDFNQYWAGYWLILVQGAY